MASDNFDKASDYRRTRARTYTGIIGSLVKAVGRLGEVGGYWLDALVVSVRRIHAMRVLGRRWMVPGGARPWNSVTDGSSEYDMTCPELS